MTESNDRTQRHEATNAEVVKELIELRELVIKELRPRRRTLGERMTSVAASAGGLIVLFALAAVGSTWWVERRVDNELWRRKVELDDYFKAIEHRVVERVESAAERSRSGLERVAVERTTQLSDSRHEAAACVDQARAHALGSIATARHLIEEEIARQEEKIKADRTFLDDLLRKIQAEGTNTTDKLHDRLGSLQAQALAAEAQLVGLASDLEHKLRVAAADERRRLFIDQLDSSRATVLSDVHALLRAAQFDEAFKRVSALCDLEQYALALGCLRPLLSTPRPLSNLQRRRALELLRGAKLPGPERFSLEVEALFGMCVVDDSAAQDVVQELLALHDSPGQRMVEEFEGFWRGEPSQTAVTAFRELERRSSSPQARANLLQLAKGRLAPEVWSALEVQVLEDLRASVREKRLDYFDAEIFARALTHGTPIPRSDVLETIEAIMPVLRAEEPDPWQLRELIARFRASRRGSGGGNDE